MIVPVKGEAGTAGEKGPGLGEMGVEVEAQALKEAGPVMAIAHGGLAARGHKEWFWNTSHSHENQQL